MLATVLVWVFYPLFFVKFPLYSICFLAVSVNCLGSQFKHGRKLAGFQRNDPKCNRHSHPQLPGSLVFVDSIAIVELDFAILEGGTIDVGNSSRFVRHCDTESYSMLPSFNNKWRLVWQNSVFLDLKHFHLNVCQLVDNLWCSRVL